VQRALRKLGLVRDIDFALYLPMRYEDETRVVRLADTRDGDMAQVEGVVTECEVVFRPRRQLIATIDDGSDTCELRFFNFYPSQHKQLAVGAKVRVRGEMRGGFVGRQMMHPTVKAAGTALPNALTPVYSTVAGLAQPVLRREVRSGLARAVLDETIPVQIGLRGAWDLRASLSFLHYPTPDVSMAALEDHSHPAWQRIKAEELLAQQLSQLQARLERAAQRAPVLPSSAEPVATSLHAQLIAVLPFGLTGAQQRVGEEITADLGRPIPMHRLLQGDVGSGKTVVAALAAARCIDAGFQCALMAPTEILAAQHFGKLVGWLDPLLAERGLRVAWLTGSQKKKERDEMSAAVESGQAALVIGTHAVISEKVRFKNLALAIIDEQHRFGVAQRLACAARPAATLSRTC
jgi:ATP-dependent DNA helicase RecG